MKLEVHERIALMNLIPPTTKSDIIGLRELRVAREVISFTPEEHEFYEIKTIQEGAGFRYNWNDVKAEQQIKDCPLSRYIMLYVRDKLVEMNRKKELDEQYISLYTKFVEVYTP